MLYVNIVVLHALGKPRPIRTSSCIIICGYIFYCIQGVEVCHQTTCIFYSLMMNTPILRLSNEIMQMLTRGLARRLFKSRHNMVAESSLGVRPPVGSRQRAFVEETGEGMVEYATEHHIFNFIKTLFLKPKTMFRHVPSRALQVHVSIHNDKILTFTRNKCPCLGFSKRLINLEIVSLYLKNISQSPLLENQNSSRYALN